MIKGNTYKRIAKSQLFSDNEWADCKNKVLEWINEHPEIEIIALQYWNGNKWYGFLTYFEYTK